MHPRLVAAVFALMPALCAAQSGPPALPGLDRLPQAATALPSSVRFGSFRLDLEKTSLEQFRNAAHGGESGHRGDAGDSEDWLCYSLDSSLNVWLTASELGGGKWIDAVYVTSGAGHSCPVLPGSLRPVALQDGLTIGVPQEQLVKMIGRPSAIRAGWWLYQRTSVIGAFDRIVTLGAHITDGKIDGLFSAQTTTN
jgi:hypothetical protein